MKRNGSKVNNSVSGIATFYASAKFDHFKNRNKIYLKSTTKGKQFFITTHSNKQN